MRRSRFLACAAVLALSMLAPATAQRRPMRDDSQQRGRFDQVIQPDSVRMEEARRRDQERIQRDTTDKWNRFATRMNAVVKALSEGVVDRKAYRRAMQAWKDLQKSEGWPFKDPEAIREEGVKGKKP